MASAKAIQQNMIAYRMNIGLGSFDNIRRGRVKTRPAPERSVFCLFREVGIWRSRAGPVSQRVFASDGRDGTSTLRYIDAAVRRNEEELCLSSAKVRN